VTRGEQRVDYVRADEAGAAGDQDAHWPHPNRKWMRKQR
jgi:hypothetical protein